MGRTAHKGDIGNGSSAYSRGIEYATEAALASQCAYRLGAAILRRRSIISTGTNRHKTHTKSPHPFKTLHAEVDAILAAEADLKGSTLYVVRLLSNGKRAISKPCPFCQMMINASGIRKVVFVDIDGDIVEERV